MIGFEKVAGPSYWAAYLVNGDASGISAAERSHTDSWFARNEIAVVIDIAKDDEGGEQNPRFTRQYQLYDPLAHCAGGEVIDYVCELKT
ncbi:MAG TPA: hypothetical protein VHX61_09435 [Rhizomicrobium sp.]|jgi:hypothetical protein|nr:hypothetical protein [Rhizomicrobium sp.]